MDHISVEQLTNDALSLPENERTQLARTLLQSLEPVDEVGVEDAWAIEVSRRINEVQSGTARGRPAADVFREIRVEFEK